VAARACTGPVSSGLFAFVRSLLQSVRIQTSLKLAASLSTLLGKNSYHGRTQQPRCGGQSDTQVIVISSIPKTVNMIDPTRHG